MREKDENRERSRALGVSLLSLCDCSRKISGQFKEFIPMKLRWLITRFCRWCRGHGAGLCDVLQSCTMSRWFLLITDCAACKQDTLASHLIYSLYKYFHGNCSADRLHLERRKKRLMWLVSPSFILHSDSVSAQQTALTRFYCQTAVASYSA